MRDIIIFTKNPISVELCKSVLLGNLKYCVQNGTSGFRIEKPSTLYFDIENDLLSQTPEFDFSADERKRLLTDFNADEVFLSSIHYHRPIDVKRLLEKLLTVFPDIHLFVDNTSDDEKTGYCTAVEYIALLDDQILH